MTQTGKFGIGTSAIRRHRVSHALAFGLMLVAGLLAASGAQAQTFSVLHSFKGVDGIDPQGDLLRDAAGNIYGTTSAGGLKYGVVFKLNAAGSETILYTFKGGADGGSPRAGLVRDASGNFYGTTYSGGGTTGDGVVFKLTGHTETVLHTFGGPDGAHPTAALIRDKNGNFYGTTFYGGTAACSCGTVFKIDTTGTETVLYSFTGSADGKFPAGKLFLDAAGNLYGTASEGGFVNCDNLTDGCGVVFKVAPSGGETVIHTFDGDSLSGNDGGAPLAGLIRDSLGNFYGTAFFAGDPSRACALNRGCGVVFELSKTGVESVLYTFTAGPDGANPEGGLVRDAAGNLYGTTKIGGQGTGFVGFGTVFKVNSSGAETVLYSFTGNSDGAGPVAGLVLDSAGNLYGTAAFGGSFGHGVVFKVAP